MIFSAGRFRIFSSIALLIFKLVDLLLLAGLGVLAYQFTRVSTTEIVIPKALIIIALLLFFVTARRHDLYRPWRGRKLKSEVLLIGLIDFYVMMVLLVSDFIISSEFVSVENTTWIMLWATLVIVSQALLRIIVRAFLKSVRARGLNQRRIVLVGTHKTANDVLSVLSDCPEYGLQVIGYVDDRQRQRQGFLADLERLGPTDKLQEIVGQYDIDQIWISYPMQAEHRAKKIIKQMQYSTVSIRFIVDLQMIKENEKSITEIGGIPLLDIDVSPMEGLVGRMFKYMEDKLVALTALVILSPIFLVLAIGIKLSSPGPVFYRQVRISWNNLPFTMLKFRSMPVDVESDTGPTWARSGERRATGFGAFLRKTSLDELPQFINVLKGEMSIIGPRPERPELVEIFKKDIPDYMKKHMVKAGITGWAQINGYRGDTDLTKRIEHDLFYIKNWSPFFDFRIALLTICKGFVNKNAY